MNFKTYGIIAALMSTASGQTLSCYEPYSCSNYFASDSYITDNVNCFGWFSCANADPFTTDDYAYCDGSYSCYKAEYISSGDDIDCHGLGSCQNAQLLAPQTFELCLCIWLFKFIK